MYHRVLLKLSGEALVGDNGYGIDPAVVKRIAAEVARVRALHVETAIVVGGGNIFRGLAASTKGMDRATADYMGMLATVLNALALKMPWKSRRGHARADAPSKWTRSPSRISDGGPFATWKRVEW